MSLSLRRLAPAVVLGLSVAAAAPFSHAQEPFRVIISQPQTPLVPNSVIVLAQELGYFADEGVNVELIRVTDTPLAVSTLQSGQGEMASIGTDSALLLVVNGLLDIRAVASMNKFLPFLIACQDNVESIADIAGRSFAVARVGSLDYTLSRMVMTSNGLDPDTVEFVAIGAPDARADALAARQIECTTISIGVWLSIPDQNGLRIVVPVAEYGESAPVLNEVMVVTAEVLDGRRSEVEGFIRALIRASRDFNSNPQSWADIMLELRPDQTPENLALLANAFVGAWSVNGGLNADEIRFSVERIFEGEDFAGLVRPELDQWVDFTVIDGILGEVGINETADLPLR